MNRWLTVLLFCTVPYAMQPVGAAVDSTLQPKAKGIDVVRATIRKIHNSCIFPQDLGFLFRIAIAESHCGQDTFTFRSDSAKGGKGIWQMDEIGFKDTMLVNKNFLDLVKQKFGIDWTRMTYASANMNVPLYNALAARLLLYRKPEPIPAGLEAQASYWKTYYNTAAGKGTAAEFISRVKSMKTCSTVGADLLFVLDASGSIGSSNFELMKQVLIAVANNFTIGPSATQIAVITFESTIRQQIYFGQHSTRSSLISAIRALTNSDGGTNTHLALNRAVTMFNMYARDLSSGFPRVVVVLTDGKSSNPAATREAAEGLNKYDWLERYAVGMGSGPDKAELQIIAPVCSHVFSIQSVSAISGLTDDLYDLACQSSVAMPQNPVYATLSGTLAPDTPRNVRDTAVSRISGRTYGLQVSSGRATLYISLSMENPSSAFNDYSAEAIPKFPGVVFVSSRDLAAGETLSRTRREVSSYSSSNSSTSTTIYLSIVPNTDSGSVPFKLEARKGDVRSFYTNSVMGRPLNSHLSKLAWIVSMVIYANVF